VKTRPIKCTTMQYRALELLHERKSYRIGLNIAKQLEKKGLVFVWRKMSERGVNRVIYFRVSLKAKGRRVFKQESERRYKEAMEAQQRAYKGR
jgi:hypothetical protein